MAKSILIKNIRAIDAKNDKFTDVYIDGGVIADVGVSLNVSADQTIDGTDLVLMPSIFDMHVHFRDPGQTHKEDIKT